MRLSSNYPFNLIIPRPSFSFDRLASPCSCLLAVEAPASSFRYQVTEFPNLLFRSEKCFRENSKIHSIFTPLVNLRSSRDWKLDIHGYLAYTCRMDGPVARAAKTAPEAAQVLREEPAADSVLPADAPADGAVSLAQFQAGNSDCTSARLGARKLGLLPVLPVPLSQHGKCFTVSLIPRMRPCLASAPPVTI